MNRQELATLNAGSYLGMGKIAFYPDGNTLVLAKPSELSVWRAPSFAEIDAAEKAQARRE